MGNVKDDGPEIIGAVWVFRLLWRD
jgi:hypothetical protein